MTGHLGYGYKQEQQEETFFWVVMKLEIEFRIFQTFRIKQRRKGKEWEKGL